MKSVVIAEKPSVGRDLARVLGCKKKGAGFIEGDKYVVTWALGHLVTLAEPADYDAKYKLWKMEHLPMIPEKFKLKIMNQTRNQFNVIKEVTTRQDINEVIIATDAGREGELVARWILYKTGWKGNIKRLWISSQTDAAIQEGFRNLKDGKHYLNLYHAATSRAQADWVIGLNVTRALTCRYESSLSAGRVQTPTLAIMVHREKEIENFIPRDYWNVVADFGTFSSKWQSEKGDTQIFDENIAKKIVAKVEKTEFIVNSVKNSVKKEQPPLAYDLTELQRAANRRFSFSAQHSLSLIQSLYERHKIVTYPRTDSRYITTDMVATIPDRLKAINFGEYAGHVSRIKPGELHLTKRLVNDEKVSDHHAIIPTEQKPNIADLSTDERKMYDLIVRRFIAVLMPEYQTQISDVLLTADGEKFRTIFRKDLEAGWKSIERPEQNDDDDTTVANVVLNKGDKVKVRKIKLETKKTQPPPRYTEATLLTAMESPGKFIEDEELRESIKDGGLGTPATRAEIIEKLISNFYIERVSRSLIPTSRGRQLIGLVPEELTQPELTAVWERRLAKIAKGQEDSNKFMNDMNIQAEVLVSEVKRSTKKFVEDDFSEEVCPKCGNFLRLINAGDKKVYSCSHKKCNFKADESSFKNKTFQGMNPRQESKQAQILIKKYSDNVNPNNTGDSLGDLLEAAIQKNKR